MSLLTDKYVSTIAARLVEDRFIVAASEADGNAWGNSASVSAELNFVTKLIGRYQIDRVYFMSESMGNLVGMQTADQVAQTRAYLAWYPVCDARHVDRAFSSDIARAFAIDAPDSVEPVSVPTVPLRIYGSYGDTVVPVRQNALVCVAQAKKSGTPATFVQTRGNHGDASNFRPDEVAAFFESN